MDPQYGLVFHKSPSTPTLASALCSRFAYELAFHESTADSALVGKESGLGPSSWKPHGRCHSDSPAVLSVALLRREGAHFSQTPTALDRPHGGLSSRGSHPPTHPPTDQHKGKYKKNNSIAFGKSTSQRIYPEQCTPR